jgi:hypothetical protein
MGDNGDGLAWARDRFGPSGPRVRELVPRMLRRCQMLMSGGQTFTELDAATVYGQMWLRVHQEFAEVLVQEIPGARRIRPYRANYRIAVVGSVPIFPWRYAKDLTTNLDAARLGDPTSDTRQAVFQGLPAAQPELTYEWSEPTRRRGDPAGSDIGQSVAAEETVADLRAGLQDVIAEHGPVVVVAYASNPTALHRIVWGDAALRSDDTLAWGFREDLALSTADDAGEYPLTTPAAASTDPLRMMPASGRRFDSGPVDEPALRPRSPIRGAPPADGSGDGGDARPEQTGTVSDE